MREKNKVKRRNGPIGLTENEKDGARKGSKRNSRHGYNTEERIERRPKYDEEKHRKSETLRENEQG